MIYLKILKLSQKIFLLLYKQFKTGVPKNQPQNIPNKLLQTNPLPPNKSSPQFRTTRNPFILPISLHFDPPKEKEQNILPAANLSTTSRAH